MASGNEDDLPLAKPFTVREHKGFYVLESAEVEDFPNFRCRDDDVWVCSFPRSGTTLIQQITYLVMTLDFEKATTVELDDRFPLADCVEPTFPYFRGLKHLDSLRDTSLRMIKCHFPYVFLPDGLKNGTGKIIYIARNPKAAVVSFHRIMAFMGQALAPTLREFIELFLIGKDHSGAPWWNHVRSYLAHISDENVLCIQFEKLVQDRRGTIKRIAEFLGKDLTPDQVDEIYEYTSLESMKTNKTINFNYFEEKFQADTSHGGFINRGDATGWEHEMPEDLIKRMDGVIQDVMADTDLHVEF